MKNILLLFICFATIVPGCKKSLQNPNDPDGFYNRSAGASANEILSENRFKSLKIEIQYMPGFNLSSASVTHLQNLLASLINKSSGITIVTKEIPATASQVLNINQVADIERANRTAFSTGDQISMYILVTNGLYSDNSVLGAAYLNTSLVLFGKKIHDNAGGIGQPSRTKLESTVLEHEFGHILGLVDLGSAMQTGHKDAAHGNHCSNSNCLMYYTADTQDILGFLVTGNIPAFDASCMADLRANGGK